MDDDRFERTIDELEPHACKWWPVEVRAEAQRTSVLPVLEETLDSFLDLLIGADKNDHTKLFTLIDEAEFSYSLFLKHLVILTDFGAEPLQRVNNNFLELFPEGKFAFDVGQGNVEYVFQKLPVKGVLNNKKMRIETVEHLRTQAPNKDLCKDIIMLLIYGAQGVEDTIKSIFYKCKICNYLGSEAQITRFIRSNYINVSKVISGKMASDLGNVAQQYVANYLRDALGENYSVKVNGTIPGVTQNDGVTLTSFDVVVYRNDDVSRHRKHIAIEVTFQETSNSTIERKGGQARDRFEKIASTRNYIAYVIDGAGNFARRSAISMLCDNSHCTVAYTHEEFDLLIEFIKEKIG